MRHTDAYAETTVRTQITSIMCANAPVNHMNHSNDLERVDRGRYRLVTRAPETPARAAESPRVTAEPMLSAEPDARSDDAPVSHDAEWSWEGNVQGAVAAWLRQQGWTIQREANTASRQGGVDLLASKDDDVICVEVKGYPSRRYSRATKADAIKPTAPPTQARQWFAGAMLSALLLLGDYPNAGVVLAFPGFKTYRRLCERVAPSLDRLAVAVLLVDRHSVEVILDPRNWFGERPSAAR